MIAVILINYNLNQDTINCIESVLESSYNDFKILLIDNGSTHKNFEELVEKYKNEERVSIKRLENNKGYVGGVNCGLQNAAALEPQYIVVINNDTIIDKEAILELAKAAERYNNEAIIAGKVYHFNRPNAIQYTGSFYFDKRYLRETYPGKDEIDIGQCEVEEERDMLDDIMWLLPYKIYKDVGQYSDFFFLYGEQADYALRAKRKGYKLVYTPKAKIWHKGSATTGDGDRVSPPANYWRNKSSVIFLYRNTQRKYFYIRMLRTTFKLIIKTLLYSNSRSTHYSALRGHISGLLWLFNKKPDNGYNPFIMKRS